MGVRGSSEGWSETPPSTALTKAWLEITVPSITPASTTTSKTTVATLLSVADASARIAPGVGSSGAWIRMPSAERRDAPRLRPATGAPFKVVLPATYAVFTGIVVAQHDIDGVVRSDVLDRDRVTQRLAGEQDGRIAGEVGRDLLHPEDRRGLDQHLRGIFVARHDRVGRAVDVGIVAVGEGHVVDQELRLVRRPRSRSRSPAPA